MAGDTGADWSTAQRRRFLEALPEGVEVEDARGERWAVGAGWLESAGLLPLRPFEFVAMRPWPVRVLRPMTADEVAAMVGAAGVRS